MAVDSAFGRISEATTDYENHRTETAYEGSYVTKMFALKAITSYLALFYVAVKSHLPAWTHLRSPCDARDCLDDVAVQLASLFVSNLVIGNLLELSVPGPSPLDLRRPSAPPPPPASSAAPERRLRWWTANHDRDERKDAEVHAAIERQFARETFNPICLDDIAELMIQYGFCTFFVVAWPPVIALAILNNCVEFHVDRFKLTCICRPPFPVRVEDLGAWNDVLWVMSRLATLTNVFMFVVSGGVDQYDATAKGLLFLLMEYLLVHVGMVIEGCVPEVPKRVVIQRKRNQFVSSSGTQQTGLTASSQAPSSWHSRPSD
ncbi:intracellular chloride channel [Aureococcus anophagefferens]|nr:intracellular chloride channel [Aureococcus anophagefferens]